MNGRVEYPEKSLLGYLDADGKFQEIGGSEGAVHVRVTATDVASVTGSTLYTPILGAASELVAIPVGAGKGPDTYLVDLSQFNSASIYLVVITFAGVVTHTAKVAYSQDGGEDFRHPATPDNLWTATAGNLEALVPKKDMYAHITLEQIGTAETVWAYLVGREVA